MRFFILFITVLFFCELQAQTNVNCANMSGICTNSGLAFQANSGIADASVTNPGNDYGCLSSSPNPAYYYLEISQTGNIFMTLSAPQDIDFIMWGPFPNLANAIVNCNSYSSADIVPDLPLGCNFWTPGNACTQIGCSFSWTNVETPSITNALAGEVYVLLVTNYANVVQNISLVQSGGSGGTNCNVLNPCDMTYINASVTSCDSLSGTYDISGVIEFNNPPVLGSLVVKNCSGDSVIYNPPFTSPFSYNIDNIYSSGNQSCTITSYFTEDNSCSLSTSSFIEPICPGPCLAPIPIVNGLTCYGGSDASITGIPEGTDGPPWTIQLINGNYTNILFTDSNITSSFLFDSLNAGSYIIRSLDTTGCYADTAITILEGIPIVSSLSNDTIICIGGTATVGATATGGAIPYMYSWNGLIGNGPHDVSPAYSKYYKVSVVDSFNCVSDYDSVLVALNPPILSNLLSSVNVCPYDSLDITIATYGGNGGPYDYVWTMDNGISIGNQVSINISPVSSSNYYYLTINDNCETPESYDSVLVSWYDLPTVDFSSNTTSGCWPVEVYFYNNTSTSQVASCDWDLGNGFYSNNIDSVVTIYNTPGSYNVTLDVTNSDGCANDTTYFNYIDIYDYPVAGFTSHPNPVSVLSPAVQFVDTSSTDVVYFDWTFYDSTNTQIGSDYVQNPSYNFSGLIEQQYYIQLYVENQNGCSDTVYGTQIVEGQYAFFLPNSFTPNGDGLNDSFFPVGDKISVENYSFKIFDRWGKLIFSTNDFNEKWDGTYQNNSLSSDAYVWKIKLLDSQSGEEKRLRGYVLLSK
ncbi:gliding motility-associated C-terminal domain-containing protein [Flavobacteriales bacterium]|nr:gliding motility-associated C-terminal domain-containing protein [Flavobacteriales bacterium]